jgi:hypothetical protein
MRNVSDILVEKIKTSFLHAVTSLFHPSGKSCYDIMWKNRVVPDRPQMTL